MEEFITNTLEKTLKNQIPLRTSVKKIENISEGIALNFLKEKLRLKEDLSKESIEQFRKLFLL